MGGEAAHAFDLWKSSLTVGVQVQRRFADFHDYVTPEATVSLSRWVLNPFVSFPQRFTRHIALEWGLLMGALWEKREFTNSVIDRDSSFQAKLKTALRIDFTPNVGLLLNPTWDLDELGSGRSFDGGNVQLRAHIF